VHQCFWRMMSGLIFLYLPAFGLSGNSCIDKCFVHIYLFFSEPKISSVYAMINIVNWKACPMMKKIICLFVHR
jgi:hypothetical protein